jgi:ketosteroid isomerase-like protein
VSRTNVEIARRAFEAANQRPKPDFITINALFHPEHEFVAAVSELEGTFRGAQGFRRYLDAAADSWDSWVGEIERITELDDERVLIELVVKLHSRRGGVPIEQRAANVMTVRNGKVTRTESYSSAKDALEGLRLSR